VLPNPHRYSAAAPSNYVRQRQQRILAGMKWLGGPSYLDTLDD
jgi:monofunctional biosynthetic peptidoglycan transglycosylase